MITFLSGTGVPSVSGRARPSMTIPNAHSPAPTAAQIATRRTCSESSATGSRQLERAEPDAVVAVEHWGAIILAMVGSYAVATIDVVSRRLRSSSRLRTIDW